MKQLNEAHMMGQITDPFRKYGDLWVATIEIVRRTGIADYLKLVSDTNPHIQSGEWVDVYGSVVRIASIDKHKVWDLAVSVSEINPSQQMKFENDVTINGDIVDIREPRTAFFSGKKIRTIAIMNDGVRIPCVLWNDLVDYSETLNRGEAVSVTGRLISREYTKTIRGEEVYITAYELSLFSLVRC